MAQTNQRGDKQLNVLAQPWFPSMTMARQRVTVYDLYGLLGVSPNVDEDGLRAAYDAITEKHQQVPSDVINAAYSVLTNPFKRAQYDRDRLEYLYKQFSSHEAFPPTTSVPTANIKGRDDQIQVYASTLAERVRDPAEDKRRAISRRIEAVRAELDEFNERSGRQRQDWATSANRVLRMAGNALCEVVVCAEEDLRMLEDELGRADGRLPPRDGPDGPSGRVTSAGCYGSDIMAMPTGTMAAAAPHPQPRVLAGQDHEATRIPRSPTVRFLPRSASKLGIGVDGAAAAEYTPSSEGSQAAREAQANTRVADFLLLDKGPPDRRRWPSAASLTVKDAAQPLGPTLIETLRHPEGLNLERVGVDHPDNASRQPRAGGAMGLVAWQRINNNNNNNNKPSTPELEQAQQSPVSPPGTNRRSNSHPVPTATATDLSAYNRPYDPARNRTRSADDPPTSQPRGYEVSTRRPDHEERMGDTRVPQYWPAWRHSMGATAAAAGGGLVARARAAALAGAPGGRAGRWVVGGEGLTNHGGDRRGDGGKGGRAEDPFA
ncbi:hypothetical protein KVR01_005874 [Diaporthe batatas]|uniref:uncharacterized protein n=1 Tax=Diaporthe batatas TaxID=748121 RepID=UPI001D045F9B|nr:uncharacterized protein KVR01_005874 [Diaporthe batatas]KAG8163956.1 hypothetical protein KVR01_005874 [Diaporthe batatas]